MKIEKTKSNVGFAALVAPDNGDVEPKIVQAENSDLLIIKRLLPLFPLFHLKNAICKLENDKCCLIAKCPTTVNKSHQSMTISVTQLYSRKTWRIIDLFKVFPLFRLENVICSDGWNTKNAHNT
jgi:hypothetical protein